MENITLGQIAASIAFIVSLIGGIEFMFIRLSKKLNSIVSTIVESETGKYIKDQKEASLCLLRSNLTSKYYVYSELGSIPYYEKENCNYMYAQYKKMGGNSYIEEIMEEINNLPIKK